MKTTRALVAVAWVLAAPPLTAQQTVDVLIQGGTLVDGTGAAARRADVGIRADRIVFVGAATRANLRVARTINANGLIVAPGFIDSHTHTAGDLSNAQRKSNLPYLFQGVTTVVTNNDGGGSIEIGRTLARWSHDSIGTNAAVFIGQGSVRGAVMGMSGNPATPAQIDSMRKLVARGMDEGAIGMSTGLYYAPGSYAPTEEVIELAKVASSKGGLYDTHMRDESSYTPGGLIGSVLETLRIGREAHIPVHISHIKALGTDVWGQADTVDALIRSARAQGIDATACQYPYTASGTSVEASLLPRWAEIGGRDSLLMRIHDPGTRARLVTEMQENMRRRGGASTLLLTSGRDTSTRGKTLAQIADARHEPPIDAALEIIQAGGASVASFNMDEKDIDTFMVQPFVMTCSDGSDGHPRKYGTFPKLFHEYVYTKHLLTLERAVQRSSGETAQTMGFKDRGTVAPGKFADIVVFDPKTFMDRSTYTEPTLYATGVQYLLVNGHIAIDSGKYTGALAGRTLRREK